MKTKLSHIFKVILTVSIALMFTNVAFGQKDEKEQLQTKKVLLQDEIEVANKILSETQKTKSVTVSQVQALNQKIRIRERLIRTINSEIKYIDREINQSQVEIDELEKELQTLKDEYAEMIVNAYKSKDDKSKIMYIIASEDMQQAFKRLQYLQEYSEYRNDQGNAIRKKQEEIQLRIDELNTQKEEKENLLIEKSKERQTLKNEISEQQKTINELQGKENEMRNEIAKKQKEVNKLEKEIEKIIADEMRRAREEAERQALYAEAKKLGLIEGKDFNDKTSSKKIRAMIEAKKKEMNVAKTDDSDAGPSYTMTPEAKKLAAGFSSNKGKLPWPVEKGIIVGKYGKQPHPVAKGVIENRPHLEIATEKGSEARAVYEGTVARVFRVQGAGLAVLISHGNYFTVYSNLKEVYVKSGESVTTKQKIGMVYTNPSDNQTLIEFGLWYNSESQDPAKWLYIN